MRTIRLRRRIGRIARSIAARFGYSVIPADGVEVVPKGQYDLVPRNYYSPIPDLPLLPQGIWERRSDLKGIDLRLERAIEKVEKLGPYVAELEIPRDGPRPAGDFFLRNENYESVDAELLYAMVRAGKPGRVVELGSGYTTLLIAEACRRNAAEGASTHHLAYDPYPRRHILGEELPEPTEFQAISATDVPLSVFSELSSGDILFVDTTHTVKLGSDVNHLVLDVLPELATGVIVHFHDIFLPWEYPRRWFEEMEYYWAEQYLLQAFLAFNPEFEVLIPAHAVAREYPERLRQAVPSFEEGVSPAAFWISRR